MYSSDKATLVVGVAVCRVTVRQRCTVRCNDPEKRRQTGFGVQTASQRDITLSYHCRTRRTRYLRRNYTTCAQQRVDTHMRPEVFADNPEIVELSGLMRIDCAKCIMRTTATADDPVAWCVRQSV